MYKSYKSLNCLVFVDAFIHQWPNFVERGIEAGPLTVLLCCMSTGEISTKLTTITSPSLLYGVCIRVTSQ